jgi:hypothetical protein
VVQEVSQLNLGIDGDGASPRASPRPKSRSASRSETDTALAKGMCGAPYFVVDNEAFWGADRLPQIEKWLANRRFLRFFHDSHQIEAQHPFSEEFKRQRRRHAARWSTTCAPRPSEVSPRRTRRSTASQAQVARGKLLRARAHRCAARCRHALPRALRRWLAYGMFNNEVASGGRRHRHRPRAGRRMHDRRQRRHGEGRQLLPASP